MVYRMDEILGQTNAFAIFLTLFFCAVAALVFYQQKKRKLKTGNSISDKAVVVLYQVGRGPYAPSPSPFPLKLETFLRMAKIQYVNDHNAVFSSKGKTPWIEYKGQVVEDSQLAIDYLSKTLAIDMNTGLTAAERSTARAYQKMTEENMYWTMCHAIFGKDLGALKSVMPYRGVKLWVITKLLQRTIKQEMWGHGIGRHSDKEIWEIGKADMTALSDFLGDKLFFMGKTPSEVDCAIFGMLAQILWHMPGSPHEHLMKEKLKNLVAYCGRMRDTFWPDWEACISTGSDFKGNT